MNDDYYELLGVDPGTPTGDIRAVYRERKAALEGKGDKAEIGRLNRAWNVLSDPYQRGRYDEQRGHGAEPGEELEGATVAPAVQGEVAAAAPARRRFFEPRPRGDRPPATPTIDVPAGRSLAQQRSRIMAMVIDVAVMIFLLFGVQALVGDRLVERWYPQEHTELTRITDDQPGDEKSQIDEAKDKADASDEAADKAEDANADNAAELRDTADADKQEYDDLNDRVSDLSRKVYPAGIVVLEGIMLACLAFLVVPSALTGQTLGKRLQRIRVIRLDGSPLGWSGALIRYGLIILATNLLLMIPGLGAIGIAVVFIVVLGWMRNANRQAMQDRIAKTLVVDA
jgi:RDD family